MSKQTVLNILTNLRKTHSIEEMLAELPRLGITRSVLESLIDG